MGAKKDGVGSRTTGILRLRLRMTSLGAKKDKFGGEEGQGWGRRRTSSKVALVPFRLTERQYLSGPCNNSSKGRIRREAASPGTRRALAVALKTLLTSDTTTRRRLPAWAVIVMLAFAVSFWGLQYKLSLYQTVAAHPAAPAAKLLSQKERPPASQHLERLLLSSRSFGKGPRTIVWNAVAAVAANAHRTDLCGFDGQDGWEQITRAARWRAASPAGPRAPPIAA